MPNKITLIKYAAVAGAIYYIYSKVSGLGSAAVEVATTKLNPMHRDNLVHQAAENIVGEDQLRSASTTVFDWIDSAAEAVGIENGINGIPGTTADAEKSLVNTEGSPDIRRRAMPAIAVKRDWSKLPVKEGSLSPGKPDFTGGKKKPMPAVRRAMPVGSAMMQTLPKGAYE